jgi:hypothetical protein
VVAISTNQMTAYDETYIQTMDENGDAVEIEKPEWPQAYGD